MDTYKKIKENIYKLPFRIYQKFHLLCEIINLKPMIDFDTNLYPHPVEFNIYSQHIQQELLSKSPIRRTTEKFIILESGDNFSFIPNPFKGIRNQNIMNEYLAANVHIIKSVVFLKQSADPIIGEKYSNLLNFFDSNGTFFLPYQKKNLDGINYTQLGRFEELVQKYNSLCKICSENPDVNKELEKLPGLDGLDIDCTKIEPVISKIPCIAKETTENLLDEITAPGMKEEQRTKRKSSIQLKIDTVYNSYLEDKLFKLTLDPSGFDVDNYYKTIHNTLFYSIGTYYSISAILHVVFILQKTTDIFISNLVANEFIELLKVSALEQLGFMLYEIYLYRNKNDATILKKMAKYIARFNNARHLIKKISGQPIIEIKRTDLLECGEYEKILDYKSGDETKISDLIGILVRDRYPIEKVEGESEIEVLIKILFIIYKKEIHPFNTDLVVKDPAAQEAAAQAAAAQEAAAQAAAAQAAAAAAAKRPRSTSPEPRRTPPPSSKTTPPAQQVTASRKKPPQQKPTPQPSRTPPPATKEPQLVSPVREKKSSP